MNKTVIIPILTIILILTMAFSSEPGNQTADQLYQTALLYETGNDSIAADPVKSSRYYLAAAERGNIAAQNYLGFRYYNGEGITHNIDSAVFWIRKAAENGDIKAAGNLGYLLSQAPDVTHDYEEAIKWLCKAVDAGLPTSFTQLADLYRQGLGCSPDTTLAISLYERAIEARIPDAQYRLLAMMGHKWKSLPADSALNLGLRYYTGLAPIAGIDLIETAANKNNPQALALLGDAYSRGIGVAYDHDLSIDSFLKAALLGNPSAEYIIAELLEFFPDSLSYPSEWAENITGLKPLDSEELNSPEFWYEKAAEKGVDNAEIAYEQLFSN